MLTRIHFKKLKPQQILQNGVRMIFFQPRVMFHKNVIKLILLDIRGDPVYVLRTFPRTNLVVC